MSEKRRGKKHSQETLKKMSESNIGKHNHKHSLETRKRLSDYHRGSHLSVETKKKISEARKNFLKNKLLKKETECQR